MNDVDPLQDEPSEARQRAQAARLRAVWASPRGLRYFSDVNNTQVGIWYTTMSFVFFLYAGVLALLMRIQLAVPNGSFLTADQYNQVFTVHGSVMMFLFAIPIFEAIAVTLMPQMLGTRDLPFPRLAAFGFWCFVLGGVFLCGSLFFGAAPKGGWFMYPPLTSSYQRGIGADIWLLGFSFIEVAAIASAVELIVGALKCRPPGMRLSMMPLYVWYTLVAAAMILFAFPPLIAGSMMLEMERALGFVFFDATRGGDPILWQHLFWLFGHPEVYIIFLPSIALVAMLVPTFARRPMVGYGWVVLSAIGTGFLSFGLWVHHMYTTGLPGISLGLFSAASTAVAIPTGIQIFCFLGTLLVGSVVRSPPMLWVAGALAIFVLGGLTGVMLAMAPFDFQAHDTYFVVAHLHYVLIGGALFPILAGVYYYYPLLGNKLLSPTLCKVSFWLTFVGFNVAFLPMHLTGLRGMPRRVYSYAPELGFDTLNLVSTLGVFVLAAGIFVIVFDVARPKRNVPYSPRNPWNAGTLEWVQEMPGESWGVRSIPEVDSRNPIWDQPNLLRDIDQGRFYLPDAEEGKRETLVTSVIDAEPEQCQRLPGPSFIPMVAAGTLGGFFIFGTFSMWPLAIVSLILSVLVFVYWLWVGTGAHPEKTLKDVGLGRSLPIYVHGPTSIGWWGLFITMLADVTAFISIVFGFFFFWSVHEDFPPQPSAGPGVLWPSIGAACALAAWALMRRARSANERERPSAYYISLTGGLVFAGLSALALLAGPYLSGLDPTRHSYPATVWLLVIWCVLHLAVGAIMMTFCVASRARGRTDARHAMDLHNTVLFWHFTLLMVLFTVAVVAGFPLVA